MCHQHLCAELGRWRSRARCFPVRLLVLDACFALAVLERLAPLVEAEMGAVLLRSAVPRLDVLW